MVQMVQTVQMPPTPHPAAPAGHRRVLVAGATGLVGRALLAQVLSGPAPAAEVHALRRASAMAPPTTHPRLHWHAVDYAGLANLPAADDVYIALGTTIRQAGSQAAFRAVDFDAVLAVAEAARQAGAQRLGVVSALGADPRSGVFYNRVKGEMEAAVSRLGYPCVVIAQPSLLVGDREALGQPARTGERWGLRLLMPLSGWIPRHVRPIEATAVARALCKAVAAGLPGVTRLRSSEMQA